MTKKMKLLSFLLMLILILSSCTNNSGISIMILFDSNGGSSVESITFDGDILDMPENPTKDGFIFDGWYFDNETFIIPLTISSILEQPLDENLTVYAKWIEDVSPLDLQLQSIYQLVVDANQFVGTYDEWLETVRGPQGLPGVDGREITLRFFETFIQWKYTNESEWTTLIDLSELILNEDRYQVTFMVHDDEQSTMVIHIDGIDKIDEPETPIRSGYSFMGWYYQDELWNFIGYVVTEDMILDAKWEEITYTISYELNGGIIDGENPTSYTAKDFLDLHEPTKLGHVFLGWYLDQALTIPYTGQQIIGDQTFYAKWYTDSNPEIDGVVNERTYFMGTGDIDLLEGVTAKAPDGENLTDGIIVSGNYQLDVAGSYGIHYEVTYNGVTTTRTMVLHVIDAGIPTEITDHVTIELWHAFGESYANLLRGYASDFMAMYPNVNIVIPNGMGNYDTLRSNLINAITANTMPNMAIGYSDHFAEYINANAVINLDPYVYSTMFGLNGADAVDDIIASYLAENSQYDINNTYYSLPFNKSTEVMIYNQTVFTELGLDVPETWQDIIDIAPQLSTYGKALAKQKVLDANPGMTEVELAGEIAAAEALVVPAAYDSPSNAFTTLARQFGGAYTEMNYATFEGEFLWHDDAQTFAAMQFLKDNKESITLPEFWDQNYASTPFVNQQTFITIGSSAGVKYNVPSSGFEIGVAPIPYHEDMPEERAVIQQGTNIALMNTGNAQEKLASWLFLKYLVSTEVTTDWAINTGYLPVRTSAYESVAYQAFINNPPTTDKYARAIALAAHAAYQQSEYMFFDPAFIGSSRARVNVGYALQRIMLGDGNIQDALDEAYNQSLI